jgi:hypothetical protein
MIPRQPPCITGRHADKEMFRQTEKRVVAHDVAENRQGQEHG